MSTLKTVITIISFLISIESHIYSVENDASSIASQSPFDIKLCIISFLSNKDFLKARLISSGWGESCQLASGTKTLTLIDEKLDVMQAKIIVNLPFSILIFDKCSLTPQALLIVSKSNKYKTIEFNSSNIADSGLKLLTMGNLTSLTSLSINHDNIRRFGINDLITGNLTSLVSLSLNNDTIGNTSVKSLFTAKNLTSLKSLSLSGNYIDDEAGKQLTIENFPLLKSLNLSENRMGDIVKKQLEEKLHIEIKL